MAGTRKSERMSERRQLEEEDEERKREDYRKRQRTLFQRTDNIVRKNDMVVNTRLGKIALVPEETPEDVKVKVEANNLEEAMEQFGHSEFSEEVSITNDVEIPTTAGQAGEDAQDNPPETEDNYGTPIIDSRGIEVKQEANALQNMTATNEQFEAQLVSLKLEMEEMRQLVNKQDQKIVHLTTELEKKSQCLEEHGKMRKAEVDLLKAENIWLVESVNQLSREVEAIKRKGEEENNLSRGGHTQLEPEPQNPGIIESDNESEERPVQDDSAEDVAVSLSVTQENSATRTRMVEDPNMEAVLSRILEYIGKDVQGLMTFRLVCRAWHQISLPTWRSTAVIKLCQSIEVTKFLLEYENDRSPYELADKPYSRYKLKNLFIDERQDWDRFWRGIGPLLKYVHFQDCVFANTTSDAFPKLLIEKMPNLKELALTSIKYDDFKEEDTRMPLLDRNHSQLQSLLISGENKIYLDRLLHYLPSLKSIAAVNEGEKIIFDDTLDKICKAKTLNPASLPELKHLDFMNTYTRLKTCPDRTYFPRQLQRLVRANLKLESFAIQLLPICEWGAPNIDPLLKLQASTLRVLKVYLAPVTNVPFKTFLCQEQMTVLNELYLHGTCVLGLDFLKYTPNLKLLHINLTCFTTRRNVKQIVNKLFQRSIYTKHTKSEVDLVDSVKDRMEGVVVNSLESLHIDLEFPEKSLRTLAKWTPNVKVLKTIVSWNNVSAVVEGWSELKELTCLFESTIRDWNICKEESRLRRCHGAVISDMKKLEHFQLDCTCDASNLTDASVFNGFLKMPSLRSIQICVTKQFSDEAEEALKHRMKNCRIIRNYTGGDHSNYGCCQRREFDLEISSTYKFKK